MRFDRRFMVVLGVSLAWALLVSGVFYRMASGRANHAQPAELKQVVVAVRALAAGSTVDRPSIAMRGMLEATLPQGAFFKLEDVVDRPVISAIQADEPLVEARLAVKGSGVGLGPMIPPGLRAVSVRVNDVVGVAGFVLPGMRVDVLVTGKPPSRTDTETQTVLQNITVLSAGQTTQADGKSQPIVAPVVTLLVNPAQAEALALANAEGHIQLVLRNSTDQAEVATRGRRLRELYGSESLETPPERLATTEPRPTAHRDSPAARAPVAGQPPESRRAAAPSTPLVAAPEAEQMIMIRGAVKRVEVFNREQEAK
jgi:pilus assembly protein CpaB